MYQSFTGSSRRPRQVNLSGKKPNPFAATTSGPGPQQALQTAQQDRAQRQQQRAELNAARSLQKTWRGFSSRRRSRQAWRRQWDVAQEQAVNAGRYASAEESLAAASLLLSFYSPRDDSNVQRLLRYGQLQADTTAAQVDCSQGPWPMAYLRLERSCLSTLDTLAQHGNEPSRVDPVARVLLFLFIQIPEESCRLSDQYFKVMAAVFQKSTPSRALFDALKAPLRPSSLAVYTSFVLEFLTRPQSSIYLDRTLDVLDIGKFIQAADNITKTETLDFRASLWLLGQFVHLLHEAKSATRTADLLRSSYNVSVVARLLAFVADGINVDDPPIDLENDEYDQAVLAARVERVPLNAFLHRQLSQLVNQESIRELLSVDDATRSSASASKGKELAGYALTLLRVFPRRADDIRMWLYLGPPQQRSAQHPAAHQSASAVSYFWRETRGTKVFRDISRDPRSTIGLLTPPKPSTSSWQPPTMSAAKNVDFSDDWRVILVFLELYTFVLKLMDDEEFLGLSSVADGAARVNALQLDDIKVLTVFLNNLGFTMHYNSKQITEALDPMAEPLSQPSLSRYFGGSISEEASRIEKASEIPSVAGITGMSLDYVKGLVTGLLRMIYERDSRRKFLPKGHWLMTSRFDMANFIQAVVNEEESRHQVQELEDEEDADESDGETCVSSANRRATEIMRRQRALRKASRRRYLETVAPRLEILTNMPFVIPFEIRVEIFREFVHLDQEKRRNGHVDPDIWRQSVLFRMGRGHNGEDPQAELQRHHAKIRRKHEFEDAYEQFYALGAGLKEPIQITFIDEFDIVEAGIDGGGVTKEFLTSVTSEALDPKADLFMENGQHLLYPNPTSVEQRRLLLRSMGYADNTPEHKENIVDLLRQYEFLGRVVGKCLYEGILVDINFAGFFLLKWALTGGYNAATNESGYRANINDLRDLDEGLYQGLLSLKNYTGNVEDLGLSFTVTDEIPLEDGRSKAVERDLVPSGSERTVTNENRLVYISYMARYRLQAQSAQQSNAFLRGLSSIIEPSWLSMFNQSELQTLIGGATSQIDVPDLRRNTLYGGVYTIGDDRQEHPSIQLFWRVMENLTDEDRRKVLKFVTSTPRAPLLGFGSLNPKFSIRDSGDDESRFPTTSTCVNLLKLPRYKSEVALRDKLLYAVNSGAGFDLS